MLKDLLLQNRSYRSFDRSVKPDRQTLLSFVENARLTPSSMNLQMLKYRLVSDEKEISDILSVTRWAGLITDRKLPPDGHEPTAFIVICTDGNLVSDPAGFGKDVGIAAQTILLSAVEAGFGGCCIGSFQAKELKKMLDLPESVFPQLLVALGKPDEVVCLENAPVGGSVRYYRDGNIHKVPKRSPEELIL